jgi:hypothetical protein
VDDALRKYKLVSHEATIFTDDPVHCVFHAFLDEWACTDFPTKHLDIFALRQDIKKWLRDNYKLLHRNGIIEDWLTEYPDIASRIEETGLRGQSIKKVKNQEWQIFCNGYALNGSCHRTYTHVWVTITSALQWQISTLLPSMYTLDWRLRCVFHLIRMEHIAPLTWFNIVHQTGSIFDPRGRCRRFLRLLTLLVRIWSSLRVVPRVWSALEERAWSHEEECRRFYSCMMDPRVN